MFAASHLLLGTFIVRTSAGVFIIHRPRVLGDGLQETATASRNGTLSQGRLVPLGRDIKAPFINPTLLKSATFRCECEPCTPTSSTPQL